MAIDYNDMLDEIIQMIRDDNEADSATIKGLVDRLQELNALGQAQFLNRKINTGNGLTGGGDLSADRTLSLAEGVLASLAKADSAVQDAALTAVLKSYLTTTAASSTYATKAEAKQTYVIPFTHPGALNGAILSPQVRLPDAATLVKVSGAVDKAGAALTVAVEGGASASLTVPAGQTSAVSGALTAAVTGPLRVRLTSTGVEGATVLLKFREA